MWTLESRQEWQQKASLKYKKQRKHTISCEGRHMYIIFQFNVKCVCFKLVLTKARALTTWSRASQNTKIFSPSFHINWKALAEYWCEISQLFFHALFFSPQRLLICSALQEVVLFVVVVVDDAFLLLFCSYAKKYLLKHLASAFVLLWAQTRI